MVQCRRKQLLGAVLMLAVWPASGCLTMSTAGFETAQTLPAGEAKTTAGFGLSTSSGPLYDHDHRLDDDEQDAPRGRIPASPVQGEYLVRRSWGVPGDFEFHATLHSFSYLPPFAAGIGAGAGVKKQLVGGDGSGFSVAVAFRGAGYIAGRKAGKEGFHLANVQGRLITSYHAGEWSWTVTPQIVPELGGTSIQRTADETVHVTTDTVLGGVSVGTSTTHQSTETFLETTVLVGRLNSARWSQLDEHGVGLPDTDRHLRVMVGVGFRGLWDDAENEHRDQSGPAR